MFLNSRRDVLGHHKVPVVRNRQHDRFCVASSSMASWFGKEVVRRAT